MHKHFILVGGLRVSAKLSPSLPKIVLNWCMISFVSISNMGDTRKKILRANYPERGKNKDNRYVDT